MYRVMFDAFDYVTHPNSDTTGIARTPVMENSILRSEINPDSIKV